MTGLGCGDPGEATTSSEAVLEGLREAARDTAAAQARTVRLVSQLAGVVAAEARRELALGPRVPGQPPDDEVLRTCVANEVQAVLGISEWSARELVHLSDRLTRILPATLSALEAGRLDLARVRVLVRATEDLSAALAREVEALLLPDACEAPWDGPSPRAWRSRVERAVARVDAAAARERRVRAVRERLVRSWPTGHGMADLLVSATSEAVAMAESVITDLARGWARTGPDGERLSMDQRRVDAFMDLLRRVRDGEDLPALPVRRQREIGLVLSAETFFAAPPDDEPATQGVSAAWQDNSSDATATTGGGDPGLVRGLHDDSFLDPVSAAEVARAELARGTALNVLLAGSEGTLRRVVRLPRQPEGGWTREVLTRAVQAALPDLPPLRVAGYAPSAAIEDHVRAEHPRCVWYDCPRSSTRCDLDHDEPWPRGPTDSANLLPRCRRNHEIKTRGLHSSRAGPDGAVHLTTLTGLVVTTRPEPLPGYGAGEAHDRDPARRANGSHPGDGTAPAAA
jgi:hypothetical protein